MQSATRSWNRENFFDKIDLIDRAAVAARQQSNTTSMSKQISEQVAPGGLSEATRPLETLKIAAQMRRWRAGPLLRGPLLVALTYFVGAEAAFYIGTLSDQIFALFWPPNVILFCALLIVPQRHWWLYIATAFPAHVVAELGVGMPFPALLLAFVTNCMVALLNAYAVRRFVGDPPWFGDFRKASLYIVIAAGVSPAVSALGGAFVPILAGGSLSQYWVFYSLWYLANALPNLTLGPVFLIWFSDRRRWMEWKPSRRHIEPLLLAAGLGFVCLMTAEAAERLAVHSLLPAVLLLPLPLILWSAVRFGEKGASTAILVIAIILTWRTLHGGGLFPEGPERSVLALQLFLTGLSVPVLLLGASIDESRRVEQTRRELTASVVKAQDVERRRIARELHDSTGQNLIAATLIAGRIENALPESARPEFRQLETMLQQSIRELRTVSYLLHPPLLDEAGLVLALRNFVNGFVERSAIAVDLEISPEIDRLPPEIELVLFRIVQEGLTNVARHSGSSTARIHLNRDNSESGESAVLTIEDAGKGMPQLSGARRFANRGVNAPLGVGLASMRERLHQIGGQLVIESIAGRTTLKATVPIPAEPVN
jgi:signal transduction histidine kinase